MAEAVDKALFIPADEHALTPNGLAVDAEGNFYVTSAFTGTIASYGPDGTFRTPSSRPLRATTWA